MCLGKIVEIEKCTNSNEEALRNTTGNDVVLDGVVIIAGNLLQFWQPFIECPVAKSLDY